jgi:CRISPR-associated RAMP protein (TIGR02581 family)
MSEPNLHSLTFERLESRLRINGKMAVLTGMRIGAGGDTGVSSTRLPVMRDTFDRPFIPGASFKGVLRSLLESLVRGLGETLHQQRQLACMVLTSDERCIPNETMEAWRKDKQRNSPTSLALLVDQNSCLLCQTFGSPWLASHVAVRDLLVDPGLWYGQFEVRQGVAIARDTETAANSFLYDFEVVPRETRFALTIECDNLAEWQKALIWLGLQRFMSGDIAIGGGRSRGLGRVKLEDAVWQGWDLGNDHIGSVLDLFSKPWNIITTTTMPTTWRMALERKVRGVLNVQAASERGSAGSSDQSARPDSD